MPGERDLDAMLAGLTVTMRPEPYAVVPDAPIVALGDGVEALIAEAEGITIVSTQARALAEGWATWLVAAWLTLDVHSALDGVGLTAAVSKALADVGIPCNVLAAAYHDHLLVPWDRRHEAMRALEELRIRAAGA